MTITKWRGLMARFEIGKKTMRGLKKIDTPIIKGYQIFHNYVRPHMGLNGMTPAERSGIKVEGEDKWRTIIENAKKN
jgi:hypothetical protein